MTSSAILLMVISSGARHCGRIIIVTAVCGHMHSLCRYCTPWLMLATTVPRRLSDCRTISVCTFSLPRDQYLVYYLADLVLFYATPLLTATVLYALIARKLLSHARPVAHRGSRRPTAENETTFTAKRRNGTATGSNTSDVTVTADTRSNVQVYIGSS